MDKRDREEMIAYIKEINTYIILSLILIVYVIIESIFIIFEFFREECLKISRKIKSYKK